MKQVILFVFLGLFLSCDDGDLQIETLNFDDSSIDFCGTATTETQVFFKISGDEALILTLASGVLKNEVSNGTIESAIPANSKITYRIFSANVSKNYFCDALPPQTPTVIDEIEAVDGKVLVNTILLEDGITYEHTIQLSDISLVNDDGSRITDLSINDFGVVTTTN
ncbi:hypothetical protein [Sediminicola sp. 1XM1-17]|uniref:hypothetical protein n=1 Tax=Sediminicola sp. 1XM1-17 TaxID=3127702 RepID=UPI0030773EF2